jgi:hypothetical protein
MKAKFGRCRSCGSRVYPVEKYEGIVRQCREHPTAEVVEWPGVMQCGYRYVSEAAAGGVDLDEYVERFNPTQHAGTDRASMALAAMYFEDWHELPELRTEERPASPVGLYGNG